MADTGWLSPGTITQNGADATWTNLSNAQAEDTATSSSVLSATQFTRYLRATNFGVSLPSGSTIDGIELRVKHLCGNPNGVETSDVFAIKGGSQHGSDQTPGDGTRFATNGGLVFMTMGGASSLLGGSWSEAEVEATDFGFEIRYVAINDDEIEIDVMQVKIYYTAGSSTPFIATENAVPVSDEDYPVCLPTGSRLTLQPSAVLAA